MEKLFQVGIPGGDEIQLKVFYSSEGQISKTTWKITGRLALIDEAQKLNAKFKGAVAQIPLPTGLAFENLLLKELVLRVQGEWSAETDPELCHCRNVLQKTVERAILLGAHSVEKVRQRTSANTGCGTCLPDVERLLKLYLK